MKAIKLKPGQEFKFEDRNYLKIQDVFYLERFGISVVDLSTFDVRVILPNAEVELIEPTLSDTMILQARNETIDEFTERFVKSVMNSGVPLKSKHKVKELGLFNSTIFSELFKIREKMKSACQNSIINHTTSTKTKVSTEDGK